MAAAAASDDASVLDVQTSFTLDDDGRCVPTARLAPPLLHWHPGHGWTHDRPAHDPDAAFLDLWLPVASASHLRPLVIGHLGQSLDGFIATTSGESQFVTGEANLLHLHRLRAMCDAIVVGAGTVAADDPQLTTRRVAGRNPLRVVLDPQCRLTPSARLFTDPSAETVVVTAVPAAGRVGDASVVTCSDGAGGIHLGSVLALLRVRGCRRIFVEGGGVTVSRFLDAGLLDRLQIAVAPLIIGSGRPAVQVAPRASLGACARPATRAYRMGDDVLFDCDLRATHQSSDAPSITSLPAVD